ELAITSWRAVMWHRSRSVSPRGEGSAFREKLRARMVSALLQSGGAWLPELLDDLSPQAALGEGDGLRILLDASGPLLGSLMPSFPITLALGPEGGLEEPELRIAFESGWQPASLGATTLRFETAGAVAVGVLRAR